MKFKYFKSVEGHVVQRYGTDTYIGVARVNGKHVWNTKRAVAIPEVEYLRHLKAYNRAVKDKSIIVATKKEYEEQNKAQEAEAEKTTKVKDKDKDKDKNPKGGAGRSPKKANKGG
jgi:hypothetical protein